MKVLIADKLEQEAVTALREIPGVEVVVNAGVSKDDLAGALEGVHVLIVRSKQVGRAAIEAGKSLALVVRAGAGVNTIDVAAASERGVYVANCPGKNAVAVAELTIGMILALDRRLVGATASLKSGRWEKGEYQKADGVFGKRIGVAGVGAIGAEVVSRARALGMRPYGLDPALTAERASRLGLERVERLVDLAKVSDVFCVHLPLVSATRGAINAEVLGALPAGAILVNSARAEVVDYTALREAIASKGLRVGLDVFPNEPEGGSAPFEAEILSSPNVIGTPHVGASTQQAQLAIASETVRIVRSFAETGDVPNCVNIAQRSPARCQLVVRHYDRVGVLAAVLGVIKRHEINVEEMANTPFAGNRAAVAKLRLGQLPSEACLREVEQSTPDVIHVEAIPV